MSYIKFSESLNSLLSILDLSANRLAKAINVDSSLVNRWVNGKRIPGYGSTYIPSIAEYFAKNIINSMQIQRLDELFLRVCGNHEFTDDPKEKTAKILMESQGNSIECKRKESKEIKQAINRDQAHSVPLSNEDKIILSPESIFSTAVILLEIAASQKYGNNQTLYLTYNNDLNIADRDLIDGFRNALLKVLNNGWNVILILRLDNNIKRTIELIKFSRPLIRTGRFKPYYINKYDTSAPGKENITIPEIGVLSCFSTKTNSEINCAFYFRNKIAIEVFKNYYEVLLPNYAQPLIHHYADEKSLDFSHYLTKSEENIGNRFLYKYSVSILALPEDVYLKLLKKNTRMKSC